MFLSCELPHPLDFSFRHGLCLEDSRRTHSSLVVLETSGQNQPSGRYQTQERPEISYQILFYYPVFTVASKWHLNEIWLHCFLCQKVFLFELNWKDVGFEK